MEIRAGVPVKTARDEVLGRVDRVVIEPWTLEITHIVVQKGFLFTNDKLVPFSWIASANEDEVTLKRDVTGIDDLPDFEETLYRPLNGTDTEVDPVRSAYMARPYFWYPPVGGAPLGFPGDYGIPPARVEVEKNIPEGTVALKEGADVYDKDEQKVGKVERIIADPDARQTTHFVLSSGVLFQDHKLIPIHWVRAMEEDSVHLEVGSRFLNRLPPFPESS